MDKHKGRKSFSKYKKVLVIFSKIITILPLNIRKKLMIAFRMTKGIMGIAIRYIVLKSILPNLGDNVSIHENVYLYSPENLHIGNNVSIHPMCYIDATGGVDIGNDVSIAHSVTIMSTTHNYSLLEMPIKDQDVSCINTKICDNVWIGAKATILCGVIINSGSIVGANALVSKNVECNTIVGGVPAREIKKRA